MSFTGKNKKRNMKSPISKNSSPEEIRKYFEERYSNLIIRMRQDLANGANIESVKENFRNISQRLDDLKKEYGISETLPTEAEFNKLLYDLSSKNTRDEFRKRITSQNQTASDLDKKQKGNKAARDSIIHGDDARAIRNNLYSILDDDTER